MSVSKSLCYRETQDGLWRMIRTFFDLRKQTVEQFNVRLVAHMGFELVECNAGGESLL